jgi:hypothetical protein
MPDLVDLLLEVLQDPTAYRRFLGRLRPKLVGRPHPKRRLARLTGSLIRHPIRPKTQHSDLTTNPANLAQSSDP